MDGDNGAQPGGRISLEVNVPQADGLSLSEDVETVSSGQSLSLRSDDGVRVAHA